MLFAVGQEYHQYVFHMPFLIPGVSGVYNQGTSFDQ